MIRSKLLLRKRNGNPMTSKRCQGCVYHECYFFHELFYQLQFVSRGKEKSVVSQSLQFKHHVIFSCCGYGIKLSTSTDPLSFLWCLLYSLVNLPLSSCNVLLQAPDINAAEFKSSLQLLSKRFQIYSYMSEWWSAKFALIWGIII